MFTFWVVFHVIISLGLIVVVLMQSSKGDGLAGTAFSGGISGAVFGGRGAAGFLSKATTVLAVVFMLNCGALAFMSAQNRTVVDPTEVTDSAVTRKAQEEMQRAAQQQQQQQQVPPGDTAGGQSIEDLLNAPPQDTANTSGGN